MLYSSKSIIHPISREYFNKVSFLGGNVSDKKAINDFVNQISQILSPNLWICWPLRSTQNIGNGTTTCSLGGLGNYNGTLVNGPTWGANGITLTSASSQYITNPRTMIYNGTEFETIIITASNNWTVGVQYTYYSESIQGNVGNAAAQVVGYYGQNGNISSPGGSLGPAEVTLTSTDLPNGSIGTTIFVRGRGDGTANTAYTLPSVTSTPINKGGANAPAIELGAIGAGRSRYYNGTISFVFLSKKQFADDNQRKQVSNILRETIGKGLGLI